MKVSEITVHAGRTFSHPHESYSNLKPQVTVRATLEDGEDWQAAIKSLQAQAESLVEDHKQTMLRSLEELQQMSRRQAEAQSLERTIRDSQERLDRLRAALPDLQIEGPVTGPNDDSASEGEGEDPDEDQGKTNYDRDYRRRY